jgi:TPR repeat protein
MIGDSPGDSGAAAAWPTRVARIGIALAVGASLGTAPARGDALRDGADAFARKDAATAMRLLAPLAEQGDPIAGCMVTVMLDVARGRVAYDVDTMAATCIDAAAGKPGAELDLAGNYRTGLVLAKDAAKAAMLYRLAADQGSAVAQKALGDLYAEGSGVQRDLAAACRWWGRAAMQGEGREAQRDYGNCHLSGTGMPRSEVQALAWWLIAKRSESRDTDGLPSWVFQRDRDADRLADALMQRMPADQVAQAQAFARAWRPKPE